jgi:hypothetical protein
MVGVDVVDVGRGRKAELLGELRQLRRRATKDHDMLDVCRAA